MLKVYNFNCVQALGPEWSWRVFFYFYFWNSQKGLLVYVNSVCKRLWLKLIRKVLNIRVGKLKKLLTMDVRRCSYELLNRLSEKFSSGSYSLKRKKMRTLLQKIKLEKVRQSFFGFMFGQFLQCFVAI